MKFEELPDTITPIDYAKWRNVGTSTAREIFHAKGFPKLQNTGNKQLADKRAVLIYELGLNEEDRKEVLKAIASNIIPLPNSQDMQNVSNTILNNIVDTMITKLENTKEII